MHASMILRAAKPVSDFFSSISVCAKALDAANVAMQATSARRIDGRIIASLPDITHQALGSDLGAIDNAILVGSDAFGRTRGGGLRNRIRDEIFHRSIFGRSDAYAASPAIVVLRHRFRFRIRDIDRVVGVDPDAAGPAELCPGIEEFAVLIENLDAIIVAVADKQPAARIHGERMWGIELAGCGALNAPFLQIFSLRVEF